VVQVVEKLDETMIRARPFWAGVAPGSLVNRFRPAYFIEPMEAFFVSTGIVALAEIGDKTQLLAFVLAAKFRRPLPIVAAIFVATVANHAFAAAIGAWITSLMGPEILRWVLGASFLAMAVWTLIPDKIDEEDTQFARYGVFLTTLIAFFVAEMGDKTQVATVALAARYHSIVAVVCGTTLGMMLANVPAVYLGDRIANRISLKLVHGIAAALFAALGIATLFGAGARLGF
jgi:putative Ca2+/H+ antiporter (TMEM165/GDT1 family)